MPKLEKKEEGLKVILERKEVTGLGNFFVNQLLIEMILFHNIVSQIFFQKIGKFDWVMEKDIVVMCFMI